MISSRQLLFLECDDSINVLNEFDSYREEKEFLAEMGILQEMDGKEVKKKIVKTAKVVDDGGEKAKNLGKELYKMAKSIYSTDEKHLLDGTHELSKIIVRCAVVAGVSATPLGAIGGAMAFLTGLAIRRGNDANAREKLSRMYASKLEYIEDKLNKVDDDKEKYGLMKLKNELKANIQKIKYVND